MSTRSRSTRALWVALALSLAVNLGGAGFFLAAESRDKKRTVEDTIAFVGQRYADPVGPAVRQRLEARKGDLARALAEMQSARRASRQAMAAEPLDRAAVDAAFEASRAKTAAFQQVIHGAIAEAVATLPADQRAVVVKSGGD